MNKLERLPASTVKVLTCLLAINSLILRYYISLQWGFQPSVSDVSYLLKHGGELTPETKQHPLPSYTPKQVHKYDHRKGTEKSEYRYIH